MFHLYVTSDNTVTLLTAVAAEYVTVSSCSSVFHLYVTSDNTVTLLTAVAAEYVTVSSCSSVFHLYLTRFNKSAIQGTPQMAVDKEAICLSRVYSYYPKCNFPLFYV